MFGFLKKLRGSREPGDSTSEAPPAPQPPSMPAPVEPEPDVASEASEPGTTPFITEPFKPSLKPVEVVRQSPGFGRPRARMERLLIELKAITDRFSPEMQSLLAQQPEEGVIIALPVDGIVEQLPTGRVEVTVAELRRFSPIHIFVEDTTRDEERAQLPLKEVLLKLDPALLQRRTEKIVELPHDIDGVFAQEVVNEKELQAQLADLRLIPAIVPPDSSADIVPEKADGSESASSGSEEHSDLPVLQPTSLEPQNPPPAGDPEITSRGGIAAPADVRALFERPVKRAESLYEGPAPAPAPPAPKPKQEASLPAGPLKLRVESPPPDITAPAPVAVAPPEPAAPVPTAPPESVEPPATVSRPKIEVASPVAVPAPEIQPRVKLPEPGAGERRSVSLPRRAIIEVPAARPFRSAPPPPPEPIRPPATDGRIVAVLLPTVDENWPEGIREETAGLGLSAAIQFPVAELGGALKRGKVAFSWRQLRVWLQPALPEADSPYDDVVLELPLSVMAPLFMTVPRPARGGTRVEVDESMPTPFAAGKRKAAAEPVCEPVCEPAAEPAGEPAAPSKPAGALGVDAGLPSELVNRACTLNGVAGAIVALNDGLLVAAKVPPELKPETLAAFLPQVFSRVEQATATMQLGELQSLMFTAGDRPWQIWKAGPVFFAAMGRPNELLPGAQLRVLATQLSRQSKV